MGEINKLCKRCSGECKQIDKIIIIKCPLYKQQGNKVIELKTGVKQAGMPLKMVLKRHARPRGAAWR